MCHRPSVLPAARPGAAPPGQRTAASGAMAHDDAARVEDRAALWPTRRIRANLPLKAHATATR